MSVWVVGVALRAGTLYIVHGCGRCGISSLFGTGRIVRWVVVSFMLVAVCIALCFFVINYDVVFFFANNPEHNSISTV